MSFTSSKTRYVSLGNIFKSDSYYGEFNSADFNWGDVVQDDLIENDPVKFFNSRLNLENELPSTVRNNRFVIQNS